MSRRLPTATIALLLLMTLLALIEESDGFGFPMGGGGGGGCCCGGGGGGGGCGGCCSTTTCSTCVGRRKRAILEQQLKTESSAICPQTAWKTTITNNIGKDVLSSEYAIQGAMSREFENYKFFVSCMSDKTHASEAEKNDIALTRAPFQFVTNGEAYCSHGNTQIWCTVVALLA